MACRDGLSHLHGEEPSKRWSVQHGVNSTQNNDESLRVLHASLRCDERSRQCQALYVGVSVIAPLVFFVLSSASPAVADVAGLVQGSVALLAFGYATLWRQRGSNLRADFERYV